MSVVSRGVRNAFRNGLRTSAVVLILAISIGLSLSMLVANKAVEGRIADLKTQVDRTVVINPAGGQGFEGGGEPLTTENVSQTSKLEHVTTASGFINFMLQTEGTDKLMIRGPGGEAGKTNLESSIKPGTLGKRFSGGGAAQAESAEFKLPIRGVGATGSYDATGVSLNVTEGRLLTTDDTYSALVGKALAEKNKLDIGSTFTAYDKTFTVVGIVDQGTAFANDALMIPLTTAQELTGQTNEVLSIVAQVDSIENLESVIANIKKTFGGDKVDVTSGQENVRQAIESLKSVQTISIVGFVAAVGASGLIVLMVMFVIVRERRREIGVLKAIGGSNRSIVYQFVVEAVVIVAMGGLLGLGTAFVGSGAIANALVSSSTSTTSQQQATEDSPSNTVGGGGPRTIKLNGPADKPVQNTTELIGEVTATVGPLTLLYGFLGMIVIAIIGSAVPAWLIAKVRPAEVLRGE